jgi:hypothetical protein
VRIPVHRSGRTLFLFIGVLFMGVGLIFVYTGLQDATRERAYQTRGQVIEAVVVSKSIQRASRDGNSRTKYEVAYRFTTPDGRTTEGVDAVAVEAWEGLEPGSPFKITYLPEAPETSRAEDSGGMGSPLGMMGLGSLLAVVGAVLLVTTAIPLWRERRLLRHGVPAQGTVLGIERSNVAVNRVRQWNVRYQYQDHFGRPQEGTSGPLPPAAVEGVEVGDTVEVRFDRERPERSAFVRVPKPATAAAGVQAPARNAPLSFWKLLRNVALVLGVLFVALVVGETVPALKALDRLAARHEFWLSAIMMGSAVVGFALFMGAILYRIFGPEGEPMSHAEVEDLSRNVGIDAAPAAARVSTYRFRGRSAGASFSDQFTLREAKEAWRQGAWRTSPRWRANIVVTVGALLFTVGLFGFFVVGAPAGIKLLFLAAIVYGVVGTIVRFARA